MFLSISSLDVSVPSSPIKFSLHNYLVESRNFPNLYRSSPVGLQLVQSPYSNGILRSQNM
ncbi:hypothetical protein BpHYR1_016433 [Brachionus plicatilis]|uniref:Uncharacterized protein n=1 Tax=Brachionus plicatilis TaxID=10195 RepID=A0A3M7RQ56_BRAPC|nr:hypothetical protein BpHYR1_016433 [Brachionus plicatilis]